MDPTQQREFKIARGGFIFIITLAIGIAFSCYHHYVLKETYFWNMIETEGVFSAIYLIGTIWNILKLAKKLSMDWDKYNAVIPSVFCTMIHFGGFILWLYLLVTTSDIKLRSYYVQCFIREATKIAASLYRYYNARKQILTSATESSEPSIV